jgi:hypothetical protein
VLYCVAWRLTTDVSSCLKLFDLADEGILFFETSVTIFQPTDLPSWAAWIFNFGLLYFSELPDGKFLCLASVVVTVAVLKWLIRNSIVCVTFWTCCCVVLLVHTALHCTVHRLTRVLEARYCTNSSSVVLSSNLRNTHFMLHAQYLLIHGRVCRLLNVRRNLFRNSLNRLCTRNVI